MGFKEVATLDTDNTVTIGGVNKKTGKANPKTIEGYFIGTKGGLPNKFNADKPNQLHILQTQNGNVGVWGKTNLDQKLRGVLVGSMIRITFTGTKPSGKGNDMLCYKVEVDADNTIDVDSADVQVNSASSSDDYEREYANAEQEEDDEPLDILPDEVEPARPIAARKAAQPPSAAAQAKVKALLGSKSKAA